MDKDKILGLARHILTSAGTIFVTNGVMTGTDLDTVVGALVVVAGIIWSMLSKNKAAEAVKEAAATGSTTPAK